MITETINNAVNEKTFSLNAVNRGTWKVILHTNRIPPHVGMLFNGNYNSLTIKNRELNIKSDVLIKTIHQRKIKAAFLKLKPHPVFSTDHQLDIFQELLNNYSSVKAFEATCLTPVKLFLNEFYSLGANENDLLYNTVQKLCFNTFIEEACALNYNLNGKIELPFYTPEELNELITKERNQFYKD